MDPRTDTIRKRVADVAAYCLVRFTLRRQSAHPAGSLFRAIASVEQSFESSLLFFIEALETLEEFSKLARLFPEISIESLDKLIVAILLALLELKTKLPQRLFRSCVNHSLFRASAQRRWGIRRLAVAKDRRFEQIKRKGSFSPNSFLRRGAIAAYCEKKQASVWMYDEHRKS